MVALRYNVRMNILTVIPISRGISKDTLTYFTKKDVTIGSIVSVPIRGKKSFGLVTGSEEVKDIKSELKRLPYSMKKVDDVESLSFLSPFFIRACEKIADYNATTIGAVLSSLIPKVILENNKKVPVAVERNVSSFHEVSLLQSDDEERYATYRSLIREEFAKNRSIFFCLPTTEDLLNTKAVLEKGIEKYTVAIYSGISKKEIVSLWKRIIEEKHPLLVILTGSFLSLPRSDLGSIVIEKESSRAYKMQARPFLDIRTVATFIAKEYGARLIFGDTFLRVETLWEEKKGNYTDLSPLKFRSVSTAQSEIIDLRGPQDMKRKEFSVLSDKLKSMLKVAKEKNELTFLFCGRKGLYPLTICSDCGTIVSCHNCRAPVVLYSGKKNNLFVCHHCGERRNADELCKKCRGWRLNPYGIGIEKIVEEVKKIVGEDGIFVMDKDHIKNHTQAVKLRDKFYEKAGGVMIGTEMALTYLNQKIENTAVVSIDAYFSIPDFQINEKIFHILLSLRNAAQKSFLIQTREESLKIFDDAIRGNLVDFYRDEIEDRKSMNFPPFMTNIKISLEGERGVVTKKMQEVNDFLKPYDFKEYEAWNSKTKSKFVIHSLLSISKESWPDKVLLSKLRELPPAFNVKIDPATLL